MKRIVEINIFNFKAYFYPTTIKLDKGENLLIYGENGSGKSSLYKSLDFFFEQSIGREKTKFQANVHTGSKDGFVKLLFKDVDVLNSSQEESAAYSSTAMIESTFAPFVKSTARTKGFLDYTNLLNVYFNKKSGDNLFDLFLDLLSEITSIASRTPLTLREELDNFYGFTRGLKIRRGKKYDQIPNKLRTFENNFKRALDGLFVQLNRFLTIYFNELGVNLNYTLQPIKLDDKNSVSIAKIRAVLKLDVFKNGVMIDDYNQVLNEARLSAISTCIYLASIKNNPQAIEYKLLFLDDIFIGLDMGNRLPILKILQTEFEDYQIILSTYDRGWYNMARGVLSANTGFNWKFKEMFAGKELLPDGRVIMKPIIISDEGMLERARRFLYDTSCPDYPAAANYYRKTLEEQLPKYFPKVIMKDENYEDLAKYKIGLIIIKALRFCQMMPKYVYNLTSIIESLTELLGLLAPLLHPLSHYVPNAPVYKVELEKVDKALSDFLCDAHILNFDSNVRMILERNDILKLIIKGSSKWEYIYYIRLEEHLFLYRKVDEYELSESKCYICKMEGKKADGSQIQSISISKTSDLYSSVSYGNLKDLYEGTCRYLHSKNIEDVIVSSNYIDGFSYYNQIGKDINWEKLSLKLVLRES